MPLTFVTVSSAISRRTSAFSRAKTHSSVLTFGIAVGCIQTILTSLLTLAKCLGPLNVHSILERRKVELH